MALWEFTNLNKHGNRRKRIIHTKGGLGIPGDGLGPLVFTKRFKYKYNHPIVPPMIWKHQGKTYLMPIWKEVVEGTTLEDVEWDRPKTKVKQEPISEIFTSSSSDKTYKAVYYPETGKYTCNCMGRYRARDGRCKHIKALEVKVK